jgi:hypothetical protein
LEDFLPRIEELAGRPPNTFSIAYKKVLEGLLKKRGSGRKSH